MNIVIGVPVRDIKAYSIGRWLKAISLLDWPDPIPIIAVDNTDDTEQGKFATFFDTKVTEAGVISNQNPITLITVKDVYGLGSEPRLAKAREAMRLKLIELKADVWFSIECDVIPPPETLRVLTPYLNTFDCIRHEYPDRDVKTQTVNGIGCGLFSRTIFNSFSFLENGGYGQGIDPLEPNCLHGGDGWLMTRIRRAGFKMADFGNLVALQHLGESE